MRAGDQFALFESVVALAMLLRRFEFEMAPNAPPVAMTTVCFSTPALLRFSQVMSGDLRLLLCDKHCLIVWNAQGGH